MLKQATSFKKIVVPASEQPIHALGYSLNIKFDDRFMMTHVYRVPLKMDEIDFILGLSILDHCKINLEGDTMDILWVNPA